MEITSEYKPISLCKTIMLLMKNKEKIEMETLYNKFPFFLYNTKLLLMGNENHVNMETTCNNFSISLYNAMMLLMGKEKHINMRRTEIDILDKLYNDACRGDKCRINTGSRKEGFRRYYSDLDYFCYLKRHRVVWSLTDLHSYGQPESVILVEHHPSIPGTIYLFERIIFQK